MDAVPPTSARPRPNAQLLGHCARYQNVEPLDTHGYTVFMGKDVGMRIRVERDVRNRFTEACQAEGETAAAVLRRFMRQYVANRETPAQQDLFDQSDDGPRERRGPARTPTDGERPLNARRPQSAGRGSNS